MTEYIIDFHDERFLIEPVEHNGEIVRCRDCYFADEIEGGYWCDRFDCGKEHVTPDGFCAWGERKEGGERNSEPFVEYAARVAKELHDEAFALLEGCDEPEFSSIDAICGFCADIVKVAKRWRIRKVVSDDQH